MKEPFAIIGLAKLKSMGNIAGVLGHMCRTRPTANSNGKENIMLVEPPTLPELEQEIAEYCPRANAVFAFDFLCAASPEHFEGKTEAQILEWAEASLQWVKDTFGADNVKACCLHMDETSPHTSYIIIPAYEGKLNAKHYTGTRAKMRGLWTSYAEAMRPFGLRRGREYSPADHKDIKAYYADVQQGKAAAKAKQIKPEQLPAPSIEDRLKPREYAAKLINYITRKLAAENGNLRAALEAERQEKEKLTGKTITDRQLFHMAQQHPEKIAQIIAELDLAKEAAANKDRRFMELIAAIKDFFKRNIPVNSVMRKPEELGALASFPELADGIKLELIHEARTNTQERGRYYGR